MKVATVLATLCVAVAGLAAVAGSGMGTGTRSGTGTMTKAEVDAWALVSALHNLSDEQEEALHQGLTAVVQRATLQFIARLEHELALDAADLEAAEAAFKRPEMRSMGGSSTIDAETIRRILTEGLDSKGIPPLDPFHLTYIPIDLDVPGVLSLQASIEDLNFDGLSSFEESIKFKPIIGWGTLTVDAVADVLIPVLRLRTQYEADASLDLGLDIWGDGIIEFVLNRLRVEVNIAVKGTALGKVTVDPCEIGISSRGIQLDIEGLFGGGLLSQLVGEIISDMVNEVLGDGLDLISQTIQNGTCGYLTSKSTRELIALLTKITSMPLPDDSTPY